MLARTKIEMKANVVITFLLCWLAGCVTLADRTYNITASQVQQKINDKLQAPISLLKVFRVNLTNSLVVFDSKAGRMQTSFDVNLTHLPTNKIVAGKLVVSGELGLDLANNTIVLNEVEVEQLSLDASASKYADFAHGLAQNLATEKLNGMVLYTMKPEDLKFGARRYQPKNMQMTDRGLQMTFSPAQ